MGSPLYYASRNNIPLGENDGNFTQEEKELIIQDLCARSPYGVKISLEYEGKELIGTLEAVYPNDECIIVEKLNHKIKANDYFTVDYGRFSIEEAHFRPYLRPISSMTEEEERELREITHYSFDHKNGEVEVYNTIFNVGYDSRYEVNDDTSVRMLVSSGICSKLITWLNKHHFDYNNLIGKGLALTALEGMYNGA